MSWDTDGTLFSNNGADVGGAVYATGSNVSNAGTEGGAIAVYGSAVYWDGEGTVFSNNAADEKGGAIRRR